jgi:hypothetical protein
LSYPDEFEGFGADVFWDEITDAYPELVDNSGFRDIFSDLFAEDGNYDESEAYWFEMEAYLDDMGINLEQYWDWDHWRAEHADS